MTTTGDRDGQQAGAHPDGTAAPGRSWPAGRSSFTEVIDRRTGTIRARGRLDRRAADMLRGTVEALHQGGCRRIVLDLGGVLSADHAGLDAVRSLAGRVTADGAGVSLLNCPDPERSEAEVSPARR